jgi:hypothetical protein
MAARFWVTGGTGNWNSTTNWSATTGGASGASVPSTADTAAFDASSGSGTATLDISPTVQTLTMTGFTGTLAFGTNTISLNSTGTIFTGATTMAVTGTPQIICTNATATTRTITTTAVTEANSISFRINGGTGSLVFTGGNVYRDLDFTDGTNPTGFAGTLNNSANTIYGNLKVSTGMTKNGGGGIYTFAATSGTKTITMGAVVFDNPFTFNGVGGSWQLQDALTSGATRTTTLTNGTLNLNGYTLTTGLFSSANSNTRTLAFGTSKIVLNGTSGTIFTTSTATGLTVTGTAPLIQATAGGAGTRTINMGAAGETNAISLDVTAGSDIVSLSTTSGAYKNVNFTGFTGTVSIQNSIAVFGNWNYGGTTIQGTGTGTATFSATSGTKTITSNGFSFPTNVNFNGIGGTFACQDALSVTSVLTMTNGTLQLKSGTTNTAGSFTTAGTNQKFLQATTNGSQATLSQASGTVSVSYLTIKDSAATGGATFIASTSNSNVDSGNNTGWNFTAISSVSIGKPISFGFGFRM